MDAFARTARTFSHHYVQVPTCGASRCALLRGRYPQTAAQLGNGAIASTQGQWGDANLPAWFQRHGYKTYAMGKITHHPAVAPAGCGQRVPRSCRVHGTGAGFPRRPGEPRSILCTARPTANPGCQG
ncbi:sulfatase-like hydrolase/transferase [Verrucomicrobium spinosum]|uniref:sulfatase-like hydrolase/transferase n=1 Tax=Verrucomicrobium spinosum TaxID=2736 RepID=UPI0009EAE931